MRWNSHCGEQTLFALAAEQCPVHVLQCPVHVLQCPVHVLQCQGELSMAWLSHPFLVLQYPNHIKWVPPARERRSQSALINYCFNQEKIWSPSLLCTLKFQAFTVMIKISVTSRFFQDGCRFKYLISTCCLPVASLRCSSLVFSSFTLPL